VRYRESVNASNPVPGPRLRVISTGAPPSPRFSEVFILKVLKVLCFDTDLQVFILKVHTSVVKRAAAHHREHLQAFRREALVYQEVSKLSSYFVAARRLRGP